MNKSKLPLYLKISPIYNKILQLAIAVICIVLLMNLWLYSETGHKKVIDEHFSDVSQLYTEQAVAGLKVILQQGNSQAVDDYIESLSAANFIHDVVYYDQTGLLVSSSIDALNMPSLIGYENKSPNTELPYIPFIKEVRTDKLVGYLRFTVDQKLVSKKLLSSSFDVHEIMRLMVIFAVFIGFLLTRGLSRFSRQGFRIAQ